MNQETDPNMVDPASESQKNSESHNHSESHHKSHSHHRHHHRKHRKEHPLKRKVRRALKKNKLGVSIFAILALVVLVLFAWRTDNSLLPNTPGWNPPAQSGTTSQPDSDPTVTPPSPPDSGTSDPSTGPLYSFGVLSDLHLQYAEGIYGGVADFQRALTYLNDKVAFTCIPGDLVAWAGTGPVEYFGTNNYMEHYKKCVELYAGDMPIYESAGNHETYPSQSASGTISQALWTQTTGKELYYSFSYGDDVFLFLSLYDTDPDQLFPPGGLQWLEQMLQANQNKRCFVFQHCPELADEAADPSGTWSSLMEGLAGRKFVSLMKQYPNTIWFHGHTHVTLETDEYPVSDVLGYKSVHVPSLGSPRFYTEQDETLMDYYFDESGNQIWGSIMSEGYIVDVYENKIIVRGIDFAAGATGEQVEPIAEEIYALNTVLRLTE